MRTTCFETHARNIKIKTRAKIQSSSVEIGLRTKQFLNYVPTYLKCQCILDKLDYGAICNQATMWINFKGKFAKQKITLTW